MAIQLTPLPYEYGELSPHISKETLRIHHDKHHKNYVDTLNGLIEGTGYDAMSLEEILLKSAGKEDRDLKVYNNAAQAWNHEFYWRGLTPAFQQPSQLFMKLIERNFGSFDKFQSEFSRKSASLFGSGWVWLVSDDNENLSVIAAENAGNPLTIGQIPLLTWDVWEHAYYLDYKNRRERYTENFWKIANWSFVEKNLENSGRIEMPFNVRTVPEASRELR